MKADWELLSAEVTAVLLAYDRDQLRQFNELAATAYRLANPA